MDKEVTITTKQIKQALDNLVDEREELQERINKAIEYINESSGDEWEMHGDYVQNKIIEILKGDSNENNI